jgi:tRNA-specific 2-thiouridylase
MKAVVLFSGGLDSTLALKITKEWGAEVYPLYVSNKFLSIKKPPETPGLEIIDVTKEFVHIVRNPQFGYGKNLNPCIDCRILMLSKAKEYMDKMKADFIVTGEVLDQRPKSQHFEQLMLIDKKANVEGLVVRPLSGALLPPTKPEQEGLIDRNLMLNFKGRSRRPALSLAQRLRIAEFTSPSGGCLLTDPGFCKRLADIMRSQEGITVRDIDLLKIGRRFRLASDTKLIVGRNEAENEQIEEMTRAGDYFIFVPETGSPNALLIGNKKYIKDAAAITARYSDKKDDKTVEVAYRHKKSTKKIRVTPLTNEEIAQLRI